MTEGHEQFREGRAFSTTQQLHDAAIGRKQLPVIFEDGWLRVPTFGGFVTKSRGLVIVRRKKQDERSVKCPPPVTRERRGPGTLTTGSQAA